MSAGLWTTSVGSLPKSPALLSARARHARGEITAQELNNLEREATREWIEFQDRLGIDIVVDGEQNRGDMATYFAERLEGFRISGLVRSYGNRYYRKPIAVGPIRRTQPITLEMYKYAQSVTSRPVKGMLTGPYTIADWSFDEHYTSREALVMDLAESIHLEAVDLERAGARYIQVDEPAISTRPEELDLAVRAMEVVRAGLKAHIVTHMCYGDFSLVYPKLLELPVDQIDLELANSNYDLLEHFKVHPFTKCIGLGVLDVHSHRIETVEEVKAGIYRAMEVLPPDRIYVDPDCGLKTRTVEEAKAKLEVMVEAVRQVRSEIGIN